MLWFPSFPNERYLGLFHAAYAALKTPGHLYIHCDHETQFLIHPLLEAAGFYVWKPVIWDKIMLGMGYHFREAYEVILFAEKRSRNCSDMGIARGKDRKARGKGRPLNDSGHRDLKSILDEVSFVRAEAWPPFASPDGLPDFVRKARVNGGYDTEKPVRLQELLVLLSSDEGQLVVDPFCGSSSSGRAALMHGRDFLGGDTHVPARVASRAHLKALPDSVEVPPHELLGLARPLNEAGETREGQLALFGQGPE